jgi:predicted NUDIX family phosphoesterase
MIRPVAARPETARQRPDVNPNATFCSRGGGITSTMGQRNHERHTNEMPAEERVLCFERKLFEELGVFQGLSLDVGKYLPVVTARSNLVYLNRSAAEQNPRYKQLIPYVLVLCHGKILRYRRGKGGNETRLHGLYSVGVGGHISEEDHGLFSTDRGYQDGMRRELREEIALADVRDAPVAVINDDSTEVGRVHFGVVHVVYAPDETVAGRCVGIVRPEFVPLGEAVSDLSGYESWSRFCLEQLDQLLAKAASLGVTNPPPATV